MIPFSRFVNGKDDILEAFWGMPRNEFFANLRNSSFCAVTAPTFSVVADCKNTPASHNVCMLLRHNRVLDEIHKAGLVAIPNLYWRTVSDQKRLTEWLQEREVCIVSRDFSRTRNPSGFVHELEQTLKILTPVNRRFHVLLIGVGPKNAKRAIPKLNGLGYHFSVVTSYPIVLAMKGGREAKIEEGSWTLNYEQNTSKTLAELANSNVRIMERYLRGCQQAPQYIHRAESPALLWGQGQIATRQAAVT